MKKIFAFLCSVLMVAGIFAFSGCKDENTLVMATNAEFPPFESIDGNEFVGIDIELARAIADELGMKLEITNMNFDAVITSVQNKQADMALAGLTVNAERLNQINFSQTYFNASQYLIVKAADTRFDAATTKEQVYTILNGLGAVEIGYQSGTTGGDYVNGYEEEGVTVYAGFASAVKTSYDNGALAVTDLQNGQIDFVVIDNMTAQALTKNNTAVKLINISLTEEEYGIGINKEDTELLSKVNAALTKFKQDGTLDTILNKYFDEE